MGESLRTSPGTLIQGQQNIGKRIKSSRVLIKLHCTGETVAFSDAQPAQRQQRAGKMTKGYNLTVG